MPNFLKLVLTWWTIANSSTRYSSNPLSHAIIVPGDDKIKFYQSFANWLEYWSSGSCNFCFTKQTVNALIWTLRSQALLFTELLDIDKYEYVIPRRLQSDPIENRFSQYRQMSGGRFLVSLREVNSSERILVSRSLLKAGINIWEDEEEGATEELQGDFLLPCATFRLHGARGGTPGWGAEHTALHPSRGKENVGRRRRNRGLVARRGTRGGRRRNSGGKGWPPWTPP